jgi:hypothetical protein
MQFSQMYTYSLRPQISAHLALKFVHKRVYISLFNAFLSRKKCFSLITWKSRPIAFSHFSTCTWLIGGGEIKEERDSGCHFPNAKSLNPNVHSFVDGGSIR